MRTPNAAAIQVIVVSVIHTLALSAQITSTTTVQTSSTVPGNPAANAQPDRLDTLEATVTSSILEAAANPSPTSVVFAPPPQASPLSDRLDALFWNNVGNPSVGWVSDFVTGLRSDPSGSLLSIGSAAWGLLTAVAGDPEPVSTIGETTGGGANITIERVQLPNLGMGPGLISGGITGSALPALSDTLGGVAVDIAAEASGTGRVLPTIYSGLGTAKAVNDIADQGAKPSEVQILPDSTIDSGINIQVDRVSNVSSQSSGSISSSAIQGLFVQRDTSSGLSSGIIIEMNQVPNTSFRRQAPLLGSPSSGGSGLPDQGAGIVSPKITSGTGPCDTIPMNTQACLCSQPAAQVEPIRSLFGCT